MNITLSSLKKLVDIKMPINKLAEELTRVGLEVEKILDYKGERVLKLDISPNRYDCLSALGISREITMLEKNKIKLEEVKIQESDIEKKLQVEIEDKEIVPKYYYYIIDNIKISESPKWMQKELEAYGFRVLNNIIDITNYVMIMLGQPLHAFDYDKVVSNNPEKKIIVRRGKKGETVATLDGKIWDVDEKTIVISKPNGELIDLAGIMGGLKSEIDANTKTIVLQAALMDSKLIRTTKKRLNHDTEAAYRYERGVDHSMVKYSLKYAAKLIQDLANGKVVKLNKINNIKYPTKVIKTSSIQLSDFVGHRFTSEEIKKMLELLGFDVETDSENITITIPTWRELDINWWQDIAEEIIRVYDISKIKLIPIQHDSALIQRNSAILSNWEKKEVIKDELFKLGLTEVYNYSFIGDDDLEKCKSSTGEVDKKDLFELAYPLSPELKYLRQNLAIGFLKTIAKNPQADKIEIFEIENVFQKLNCHPELDSGSHIKQISEIPDQAWNDNNSNSESTRIGIACAGEKSQNASDLMTKLIKVFGINCHSDEHNEEKSQNQNEISHFVRNDMLKVFNINPELLKQYKIRKPNVSICEIDFGDFLKYAKFDGKSLNWHPSSKSQYRDLSQFPTVERDLAIILDRNIENEKTRQIIMSTSDQIISSDLFDEFANDKFGENKKSVAYHISMQSPDHTLTSSEAENIIKKILENIKNELGGELRR